MFMLLIILACIPYEAPADISNTSDNVGVVLISPAFSIESPEDGLKEALAYYDIKHPDIVYAQAVLETGHFTSRICTEDNNLFGLYDSKNKCYYKFNHWTESVIAYKKYIQYKYKSGDYYKFLKGLGYAENPEYTDMLKELTN